MDLVCDRVALVERDAREHARERLGDAVEGVVVVVEDDHAPGAAEDVVGAGGTRELDGLAHVIASRSAFFDQ